MRVPKTALGRSEKKKLDRTGAGRSWRRPCHRWLIGRLLSARIKAKAKVYGGDSSALTVTDGVGDDKACGGRLRCGRMGKSWPVQALGGVLPSEDAGSGTD